jgi:hypothetical protein
MAIDQDSKSRFIEALGKAITTQWHAVGQDVQRLIFEAATKDSDDPKFREDLAVFLHEHHPRTD